MEQRQPLLSDERLKGYKGEATIIKLLNNPGMSSHEVRSFYENLITKGKLVVPKTISGDTHSHVFTCSGMHIIGMAMRKVRFCPGCGAKIVEG